VSTPRDYEGSLRAIEEMVALIENTVGERGTVGIGIPGMVSPRTGIVKNANSTWLIGKPLERALERRLGRRVRLMSASVRPSNGSVLGSGAFTWAKAA